MYLLLYLVVFHVPCIISSSSSSSSSSGYSMFSELSCQVSEFTCLHSGECISFLWVCDEEEDCYDGSDEYNCNTQPEDTGTTTNNPIQMDVTEENYYSCSPGEYTCDNGQCIPSGQRCDLEENCYDGSDEHGCYNGDVTVFPTDDGHSYHCGINEYTCSSQHCIPWYWVCNGIEDCFNGSDEVSCSTTPPPTDAPRTGFFFNDFTTIEPGPCYPDPCGQWGRCRTNFFITLSGEDFRCDCYEGHIGEFCEIDLCEELDCQNGAECDISFWTGEAHCNCKDGYEGTRCEEDLCDPLDCRNNGTCEISWWTDEPYCSCSEGFGGEHCEQELCAPINCLNNGECEISWWTNEPYCSCPKGFGGPQCENDLCAPLNCLNNGKCEISWWTNNAYCSCPEGFGGKQCEKELCAKLQCNNNGKCEIPWWSTKPLCDCPRGYAGKHCEHDCKISWRWGCNKYLY